MVIRGARLPTSGYKMVSYPPAVKNMRAICLDGGGYLGLATASFLSEIERHFHTRTSDQFDLFCGTSTGGIIALCLASGLSASDVMELYRRLGKEVFVNSFLGSRQLRWVRGLVSSRYSNKNLVTALRDVFGDTTLGDVKARGKYVVVPAFSLSTGSPRVFKTDHAAELSRDDAYLLRDIALATSAAPVYLPIASLKSPTSGAYEQFVDGGVYANNPTLIALTEAVGYLKCHPSVLQVLSISTPRDIGSLAEPSRPLDWWERFRLQRGLLAWGSRLADLFVGSSMQLTHSAVNRVMVALTGSVGAYERIDLPSRPRLTLDRADDWASETLLNLGNASAAAGDVRSRLAPFFAARGV